MNLLIGPFGAAQLLRLINNSEVRASVRRFAPRHFAAFVDRRGIVVLVVRSKAQMTIDEVSALARRECPTTPFFIAESGHYKKASELQEKIDDCVRAYQVPSPRSAMETQTIDGKNVLVIGARTKSRQRDPPH